VADTLPVYRGGDPWRPGDPVTTADIFDIRSLWFEGVDRERDGFLWIRGDRHGVELFFNFLPARDDASPITAAFAEQAAAVSAAVRRAMGRAVLRRLYAGVFATTSKVRKRMARDGWCPSPLLLPDAWRRMVAAYEAEDPGAAEGVAIAAVDAGALARAVSEWRAVEPFAADAPVLERGVERHLAGDHVSAVAVLLPRLEGLANRVRHARSGGVPRDGGTPDALSDLDQLAGPDTREAWLPREIRVLLRATLDKFFLRPYADGPAARDALGRHAHAHGATAPEHYTPAYALKVILALDALFAATR
jgi:hypothetical protein